MAAEAGVVDVRFGVGRENDFDLVELEIAYQTELQDPSATREIASRARDLEVAVAWGTDSYFLEVMSLKTSFSVPILP